MNTASRVHFYPALRPTTPNRPTVVWIPGGPGLSSKTLESMLGMRSDFDLALVDPPGTGGLPNPESISFELITDSIEKAILELGRPVILCGLCFGGIVAAYLAAKANLEVLGVVCVGSPLQRETFQLDLEVSLRAKLSPQTTAARDEFFANPNDENFRTYLGEFGQFCFITKNLSAGREMLRSDQSSAKLYTSILMELVVSNGADKYSGQLKNINAKKLALVGSDDQLCPPSALKRDAQQFGFICEEIADAGHFVTYDQPKAVELSIKRQFGKMS